MTNDEKQAGSTDDAAESGSGGDSGSNGGNDSGGESPAPAPDWKLTTIKKSKDLDGTTKRERDGD